MKTKRPTALTLNDLRCVPKSVADRKFITKHAGYIGLLIYPNGNEYPIEHYRMDTPEKVLGWITHLIEKDNVKIEHIQAFLNAADELGVAIHTNA